MWAELKAAILIVDARPPTAPSRVTLA